MYQLIKEVHSLSAYIVLVVLFLSATNALMGYFTKKETYQLKDLRLNLFALIFAHIQLLLGLLLYVLTPLLASWQEGKMVMKTSLLRLLLLEHPLVMITAVVLITIGWSKHKKQDTPRAKFAKIALFYGIAFVLVLSRLPWKLWWGLI